MKVYQPNRKDLLINTDWGVPKDDITAQEAEERNLVLFKKKWVTTDEKKILKKQINTYKHIRGTVYLFIFVACVSMIIAFVVPSEFLVKFGGQVGLFINAVIHIFTAIGLWHYKGWARWVASLVVATYIASIVGIIIVPILLYYLHNNVAEQIFVTSVPKAISNL